MGNVLDILANRGIFNKELLINIKTNVEITGNAIDKINFQKSKIGRPIKTWRKHLIYNI